MDLLKRIARWRLSRISLVAGLVIALGLTAGWSRPKEDQIMSLLGLETGELVTIEQEQTGKSEIAVEINGQDYVIDYAFFSIRSSQFRLMVQQENGELVEQDPPAVSTIRGTLRGVEGSRVVGSLTEVGLSAMIKFPSGENYYIEPVSKTIDDPALAGTHVVYSRGDVIPHQGTCGAGAELVQVEEDSDEPLIAAAGVLQECEVAVDADFEYFATFGFSTNATLSQIELILNIMNDQYESEVGIRHTVSVAVVRTNSVDPYSTSDPEGLLGQVQALHQTSGIPGDLVHLFTGRDLQGTTIGIAFIGAVCDNSIRYGLSQHVTPLSQMTDLVAHELGHNWNQQHCTCPDHTMNPSLMGANTFNPTITVPSLVAYRDTLTCLDSVLHPDNDDWFNETFISEPNFSVTGSNVNATTEVLEQNLFTVGSSVWWFLDPGEDGTLTLDTFGSDFDTQLHVYEFVPNQGFAGLILLESNDDTNGFQSRVTLEVNGGTCYEIRVGGFRSGFSISDGSEGNIQLNGTFVPDTGSVLLGDVNRDNVVSFLDITPFISLLTTSGFQAEADFDGNNVVDFLDIAPFISALSGS